jgi:hypothetical protein
MLYRFQGFGEPERSASALLNDLVAHGIKSRVFYQSETDVFSVEFPDKMMASSFIDVLSIQMAFDEEEKNAILEEVFGASKGAEDGELIFASAM